MILRYPISRAISAYHHHYALGRINRDISIVDADPKFGIIDIGLYARHLDYWHSVFGDNLHVYFYDELKKNTVGFLQQIFQNLDTEDQSEDIANALAKHRINSKKRLFPVTANFRQVNFPKYP